MQPRVRLSIPPNFSKFPPPPQVRAAELTKQTAQASRANANRRDQASRFNSVSQFTHVEEDLSSFDLVDAGVAPRAAPVAAVAQQTPQVTPHIVQGEDEESDDDWDMIKNKAAGKAPAAPAPAAPAAPQAPAPVQQAAAVVQEQQAPPPVVEAPPRPVTPPPAQQAPESMSLDMDLGLSLDEPGPSLSLSPGDAPAPPAPQQVEVRASAAESMQQQPDAPVAFQAPVAPPVAAPAVDVMLSPVKPQAPVDLFGDLQPAQTSNADLFGGPPMAKTPTPKNLDDDLLFAPGPRVGEGLGAPVGSADPLGLDLDFAPSTGTSPKKTGTGNQSLDDMLNF